MEIEIIPVTKRNYLQVRALNVAKSQENFIESIEQCLKEAAELALWRPVAIQIEQRFIGFAMYGFWPLEGKTGRAWLDRFLIDERYQGKGYGKAALLSLLQRIAAEYQCAEIYLSLYEDNLLAARLYEKNGFRFNGEIDEHGEKVMVLRVAEERVDV